MAVEQLADALGFRATVFPRWGELTIRIDDDNGSCSEIIAVELVGMDMSKVAAMMSVIDKVCDGRIEPKWRDLQWRRSRDFHLAQSLSVFDGQSEIADRETTM